MLLNLDMDTKQVDVKSAKHSEHFFKSLQELFSEELLTDVTLISDDTVSVKAHKIVLASCSMYFQKLLCLNPSKHPIIVMKGVDTKNLKSLLTFIYSGQVNVDREDLSSLGKIADHYKITGLAEAIEVYNNKMKLNISEITTVREITLQRKCPGGLGAEGQNAAALHCEVDVAEPAPFLSVENLAVGEAGEIGKNGSYNEYLDISNVRQNTTPVFISSFKTLPSLSSGAKSEVLVAKPIKDDESKIPSKVGIVEIEEEYVLKDKGNECQPDSASVGMQTHFDERGEYAGENSESSLACYMNSESTFNPHTEGDAAKESLDQEESNSCIMSERDSPYVDKSSLDARSSATRCNVEGEDQATVNRQDIYLITPNSHVSVREIPNQMKKENNSFSSDLAAIATVEPKCFTCDKSFNQLEHLQMHYKENHFPISYPCPWCMNKGLRPIKNVANVKFCTYVCCYCKKIFGSKQYLH